MNVQENYEQWLKDFADDQETVRELESIRNDAAEIEDRFYTELSFGTAGMRGVLGAGTNRMNRYNVRRATKGLAAYLKQQPGAAERGVVIAYASVYGGTENAANILACRLREQGVQVDMFDTSVTPASYILAAAFRFSHVVLAAPTYNGGVFVTMENLLHDLTAHGLKGRRAAYIENGSWAPTSARGMQKLLEPLNWETAADTVTLRSALRQGQQEDLERMAMQLAESVKA